MSSKQVQLRGILLLRIWSATALCFNIGWLKFNGAFNGKYNYNYCMSKHTRYSQLTTIFMTKSITKSNTLKYIITHDLS